MATTKLVTLQLAEDMRKLENVELLADGEVQALQKTSRVWQLSRESNTPRSCCTKLCKVFLTRSMTEYAPLLTRSAGTPGGCARPCRSSYADRSRPPSTDGRTRAENRGSSWCCTKYRNYLTAGRPESVVAGGAIAACRCLVHDVLQLVWDRKRRLLAFTVFY